MKKLLVFLLISTIAYAAIEELKEFDDVSLEISAKTTTHSVTRPTSSHTTKTTTGGTTKTTTKGTTKTTTGGTTKTTTGGLLRQLQKVLLRKQILKRSLI